MGISSPGVKFEDSLSTRRLNSCAVALSCDPLEVPGTDSEGETMVATTGTSQVQAKDGDLAERQGTDPLLGPIVQYLKRMGFTFTGEGS